MTMVRRARPEDAYPLWLWANDPAAREASGNRPEISWADHLEWYRRRLDSPNAMILIAEEPAGCLVGVIRFETADRWNRARLSYSVAPEARRRGVGGRLLDLGIDQLLEQAPTVTIEAEVRGSNAPSIRLFQRLGWRVNPSSDGKLIFVGPIRECA